MKLIKLFAVILCVSALVVSCKPKAKDMTIEDYSKIDMEVTATDMKPESIETIAKKYGYTLDQYKKFSEKVEKDQKLQEKLGEIRLKDQEKEPKAKDKKDKK